MWPHSDATKEGEMESKGDEWNWGEFEAAGEREARFWRVVVGLTNRPRVIVDPDAWPVVAEGGDRVHDGEVEHQANEIHEALIRVRQHQGGRVLVYGRYRLQTSIPDRRDFDLRAGYLLIEGVDVAGAVRRVERDLLSEGEDVVPALVRAAARECIASLPAEEI